MGSFGIVIDVFCLFTIIIVVIQSVFTLAFSAIMFGRRKSSSPDGALADSPTAAIILCVRGTDPFLPQCIAKLLDQDYESYELHIVVDSEVDPAWDVLREFESDSRVRIRVLEDPLETCSLKCSSLVQAVNALDSSFEVVAFCDADCVPHRTWLAELVAPFADPSVGVTTGNRWYHPPKASGAPLMRYLWNIPAAVNMVLLRIAWGGSLAVRHQVIHEAGLLARWSKSLCEDTMLFRVLRKHGYRQVFVPSVFMVNREACTLRDLASWVPRQLLTAKLYHPSWIATVGYGIISSIVPVIAIGMSIYGWITGDATLSKQSLIILSGFEVSNVIMVMICQWSAFRQISNPSSYTPLLTARAILILPIWILVSQLIAPLSFIKCFLLRTVSWRGIDYRIRGQSIQRGRYSVFEHASTSKRSL